MATPLTQAESIEPRGNRTLSAKQRSLIQTALSDILQSAPFRTSKQSQQLLQYIVEKTAEGQFELLKERIIGAQVFGRRVDYDTNEDPVVRARAGEVRKRLAQYYLGEGSQITLRIEISPGSYHASFVEPSDLSANHLFSSLHESRAVRKKSESAEVDREPVEARAAGARFFQPTSRRLLAGGAGILAIVVAMTLFFWPQKPIDVFWEPLLSTNKQVLIYSGANAVYRLSADFMNRYMATHHLDPLESQGREFVVPLSQDTRIDPNDLVSFKNEFVTLGDLAANVRIAAFLTTHKRSFDLRSGEDVAFGDLRESPTLLVGAFNNSWTMELMGDLPFTFDRGLTIRDNADQRRSWTPTFSEEGAVILDYGIVTRLPHSKTGQPLITVAGITQSGTRAVADFITSPQLMSDFVKSAPKNWARKNIQLVIQTKVVNNIPTAPVIVATRYW